MNMKKVLLIIAFVFLFCFGASAQIKVKKCDYSKNKCAKSAAADALKRWKKNPERIEYAVLFLYLGNKTVESRLYIDQEISELNEQQHKVLEIISESFWKWRQPVVIDQYTFTLNGNVLNVSDGKKSWTY